MQRAPLPLYQRIRHPDATFVDAAASQAAADAKPGPRARPVQGARGARQAPPGQTPQRMRARCAGIRRLDHAHGHVREARDGRLYVFMPPIAGLEDYLELVAAVEDTAEAMQHAGPARRLQPPRDARLISCQGYARPRRDRGQHPAVARAGMNWSKQTSICTSRRADRGCRTEKFMLDGRHTGTGGGNHFVLGGADAGGLARSCAVPTCLPA